MTDTPKDSFNGGSDEDREELTRLHREWLRANGQMDREGLRRFWSDDPENVFFNANGPGASHVGIATSNSTVISATTHGVREHAISDSYWGSHYVGARRV